MSSGTTAMHAPSGSPVIGLIGPANGSWTDAGKVGEIFSTSADAADRSPGTAETLSGLVPSETELLAPTVVEEFGEPVHVTEPESGTCF